MIQGKPQSQIRSNRRLNLSRQNRKTEVKRAPLDHVQCTVAHLLILSLRFERLRSRCPRVTSFYQGSRAIRCNHSFFEQYHGASDEWYRSAASRLTMTAGNKIMRVEKAVGRLSVTCRPQLSPSAIATESCTGHSKQKMVRYQVLGCSVFHCGGLRGGDKFWLKWREKKERWKKKTIWNFRRRSCFFISQARKNKRGELKSRNYFKK